MIRGGRSVPWRGPLVRRYLAYVAVAAVTMSAAGLYSSALIRQTSRSQTVWGLTQAGTQVANLLRGAPGPSVAEVAEAAGTASVRVTVIRSDGVVLGDSWADAPTMENHADRPEVREALAGRTGVASRPSASVGRDLLYVAVPSITVGGASVVVRASAAVEDLRGALSAAYRNLAVAALFITLITAALAIVVERRMVEPIAALERAAIAFARGDLEHTVRISSPPDLARVAQAMNEMAAALRARMRDLEEKRNELEAVFSGMGEALLVLDPARRVRALNGAARMLIGSRSGPVEGRTLLDLFLSSSLDELVGEVQSSGASREAETVLRAGGGPVCLQARATLLERSGGVDRAGGVVLVLNDITRLKRLEEVRRDFVANVSHELKTPITTMKATLDTLRDGALKDPEASERFLDSASRHAERLDAIVDDLLTLSSLERPDNGARAVEMETRDLREVARAAMQLLSPQARDRSVLLELDAAAPTGARVHSRLMEQAIANLVDNAIKYSAPDSTVTVRVATREDQVAVSVEDHGIGIPSADLPRVFERFYRVDKARSRDLGGTGLGLAIVKHIALMHGGSVEARSTLGQGSTFTILLPSPLSR